MEKEKWHRLIGNITKPIIQKILPKYLRYSFCPTFISYSPRGEILSKASAYVSCSKMEGDYLEFGVWMGNSFVSAYHFAQKYGLKDMDFYAFDSFEGLPTLKGIDANESCFHKGQFSCSEEEFKRILKRKGVDLNKVKTIKGWYKDTLNDDTKQSLPLKKASIIWIDSDLYDSAVSVLDFITKYIQNGTLLIFDDWFCFKGNPKKGEQLAFKQWLEKNPHITASEYYKFSWGGNSFILHKRNESI